MRATRAQLAPLKPKFVSVTFGAGGSTQQGTLDTVLEMAEEGLEAAPHLSCIGSSKESLRAILGAYRAHGIRHIVALRGDLPSGMGEVGELRYASELVSFIARNTATGSTSKWPRILNITRNRARRAPISRISCARCRRARIPRSRSTSTTATRISGSSPTRASWASTCRSCRASCRSRTLSQLMRFSEMCGAEVPKWIARRLESFGDDREAIREFRAGRRDGFVQAPDRRRRARVAFLYAQRRGCDEDHLRAARAGQRLTHRLVALYSARRSPRGPLLSCALSLHASPPRFPFPLQSPASFQFRCAYRRRIAGGYFAIRPITPEHRR